MKGKIAILVLLAYFSPSTEGLQCFTCGHVTGLPSEIVIPPPFDQLIDPSCKAGSTPAAKFAQPCDETITDPICVSANAKVSLPAPINQEVEGTIRGCLGKMEGLKDGCERLTVADMLKVPGLDPQVKEYLEQLKPTDSAQICTCTTDKCTAEGEGSGGGSAISRIAQILMLCPLIVLFIAKFS